MDEQEQADRMAAAEALTMISTRGSKNKSESATRRSRRGRKKKEIIDYGDKIDGIHTDTSEDEVKLKKSKRGQPANDNVTTKSSGDWRASKVRTIGKKFNKDISDGDYADQSKISRPTPKKRHKTKNEPLPLSNDNPITTQISNEHEIHEGYKFKSSKTHKKTGKGKFSKVANEAMGAEGTRRDKEIKAMGFTGVPVTLSSPKVAKQTKPSSPRRTPSTNSDSSQQQLKSLEFTSPPTSLNLLSMNASIPETVSLPSLPTGIGSLQLSSIPVPSLSSLTETKRPESSVNDREESQKQLPLKKRKLLGAAQVEEEKMVEDISDAEDEGCPGQVQATFTVQAPPIITMQTLMEIKTALTPDEDGDLPLHIAVVHENMRMVTKLINLMRIAVKGVDKFNKQQQTPLHLAVKLNFVPAVDLLITSGGNINTVDWTGSSAIHMAVQGGFYECLELILKRCPYAEINARNFEGLSPLHLAVTNKDMKQVQLLLKYKADIDLLDGKSGRTALFHAAETNQKNLVELLLKQGANPDLTNYAGVTATMAAQGRNLHSILKLIGSVVQDKQDNKWSTVTVKSQSGSVMMQVNQDSEVIDGSFIVEHARNSGGSTSSLLQRQYPVSRSLLTQGTGNVSSDNKARMYENMVVVSEPGSVRSESLYSQQASPSSSSSPNTPRPPPDIKIEAKGLSSIGHLDSPYDSKHYFVSSRTSPSSFPVIRVKQEVNDNSSEDTNVTLPSSTLSSSSSNTPVIISKSIGLPESVGAIGISGKPIMRELPAKTMNNNSNTNTGNVSISNMINKSHATTTHTQRQSPHNEQMVYRGQSPRKEVDKLSVPSGAPRRLSSSPTSLPLFSLRSTSPNNPSSIPSSPAPTTTTTITSNSDTFPLTSNQARLYKRLLEMYNINPGASSPLSSLPSATPLRSLPILPLSSHPSSDNKNSPPLPSSSSTSSSSSSLPPSQSGTQMKSSGHNTTVFNLQDRRQLPHSNQPFLLQRSLSTQDSTSNSLAYPPTNDKPLTPPQKVSILRVSDPAAATRPFKSNFNNNLSREERQHSHALSHLLNEHPKSQVIRRVLNHNDNSQLASTTMEAHPPSSDVPLNLSAKNYSSLPVGYSDSKDRKMDNNDGNNDNKHPLPKSSSSISGAAEDKSTKINRDEHVKSLTTLPEFPHITKSVSPKTASFVRNFLSQQKQHLQQYNHHQQSSTKQDTPSSNNDIVAASSSPLSSKQTFNRQEGKSHLGTLKSINIPPLMMSKSSLLLSRNASLPSTQSSSLPASPSSVVSTLSLPVFNVKTYLSLSKDSSIPGLVTLTPSTTTTASTATTTPNNPSFLHQTSRVIDLSIGEEHRGAVNKLTTKSQVNYSVQNTNNSSSSSVESNDKDTDITNNMEGKMVGFSGAIISIPSSLPSSSSSSSLTVEKSNMANKVSESAKMDKTSLSSSTLTTSVAAPTTNMKDKAKRKGRKAGGGAKSTQATPSLPDTPMPMQNKINSETDQRLKKFLGMKRSEQSNNSGGGGGSAPSSSSGDKVIKERIVPGDAPTSKSQPESSGGANNGVNNDNNNSNNNVNSLPVGQSAPDHPKDSESTIETVGIFSGNIQHVKIKSSSLKSLPVTTSSSKVNNTGSRKSISPNASTALTSNLTLPSSVALSSWPLSSKHVQSSSSSLSQSSTGHVSNLEGNRFGNDAEVVVDGRNSGTSSVSMEDEDNDVIYSERIVWRSSPLLMIPSPSPSSETQEVSKKAAKKSQKLKKDEKGKANVYGVTTNAAVVVKPAQEDIKEFSLTNASSEKDLTSFDKSVVSRRRVDKAGDVVTVGRGSVYDPKDIVTLYRKKGNKKKLHDPQTSAVAKIGDKISGPENNTVEVRSRFEKADQISQRKEGSSVGGGDGVANKGSDSFVLRKKEKDFSHKEQGDLHQDTKNCSGRIVNSIGDNGNAKERSGVDGAYVDGRVSSDDCKKVDDIGADVVKKASAKSGVSAVSQGSNDSCGSDESESAVANRMSVEEEQELVIDLGTPPTESKTFELKKTK